MQFCRKNGRQSSDKVGRNDAACPRWVGRRRRKRRCRRFACVGFWRVESSDGIGIDPRLSLINRSAVAGLCRGQWRRRTESRRRFRLLDRLRPPTESAQFPHRQSRDGDDSGAEQQRFPVIGEQRLRLLLNAADYRCATATGGALLLLGFPSSALRHRDLGGSSGGSDMCVDVAFSVWS